MFKRVLTLLIAITCLLSFGGCKVSYSKYQKDFYDVFDTYTVIVAYDTSQKHFDKKAEIIYQEMARLHKLYDIYNDYEGIINLKAVNDNAGIAPVVVDKSIIDIVEFGVNAYKETNGSVNIAMGSVLKIWHEYRDAGTISPQDAKLPPMALLEEAAKHTSIDDVVIDKEASTIFLKDPKMALDVGAVAKGYAVEVAAQKANEAGLKSFIINAGGNVRTWGSPMDGRESWSIGIEDPDLSPDGVRQISDTIYGKDIAVVSSGDYQRYYEVDGIKYHHIIDPKTLMPANQMRAVSIVYPDSGVADMLSTATFILPFEEGKALLERFGAQAIWIYPDEIIATDGYKAISKNFSEESAT